MRELGVGPDDVQAWFVRVEQDGYTRIDVPSTALDALRAAIPRLLRRSYIADDVLVARADALAADRGGTREDWLAVVLEAVLPDPGSVMSGEFGEILTLLYGASTLDDRTTISPKKWRLKHDRTKPTQGVDVLHLTLPHWPTATEEDAIYSSEVKSKATSGGSRPVESALKGCGKDRVSRLAKTLNWLRDRAFSSGHDAMFIDHLTRFIDATEFPPAKRYFRAVVVACATVWSTEAATVPSPIPSDCDFVVIVVPDLQQIYMDSYAAVAGSLQDADE